VIVGNPPPAPAGLDAVPRSGGAVDRSPIRPATPSGSPLPLPTDLSEAASRRLGIACLVWAALWGLALLLNLVVAPLISPERTLDDAWPVPGAPVAAGVIVLSLALFAYARRAACDCELVLSLGLFYEVALAFAIGLVNQWTPNTAGLSWICVLILIHPMIVPHKRRWNLLAAVAAASMDPVGLAVTAARGVPVPTLPEVLWFVIPNYISALLVMLPSHVIARLGREVNRARDMGGYQVGELLGKGGMGEVYLARHLMLRRPAAVKLIRPEALGANRDTGTVVQRFRREAQTLANLHSPHTIVLYDFGITRGGTFYYVMELLHGLDFESLVRRFGPVGPARTVHLLRQACVSLAEAHAHGLVHRDVKPTNLFTCWMGLEPDFVKVLDFGLVKGELAGEGSVTLTAPDITTGTPAYMAPELAQGGEVDGRADVYALGCVAYWLLTGRMVFEETNPTRMILAHVRETPKAPSVHSEFKIPESLDALILDCLEKDPARRPQNANALARRLSLCGPEFAAPWSRDEAERWWREHVPDLVHEASHL
jgi:serine/threonine-protein kinase